jgi:hypothetical protein
VVADSEQTSAGCAVENSAEQYTLSKALKAIHYSQHDIAQQSNNANN